MRKVQVLTDSCSDLTPEIMERFNIDYCKMSTVYNDQATPADLSWTAKDVHAFYDRLRAGERITTTQVPVEEFNTVFRKYLDQGCDIVYVGCSLKQSGSVNTAQVLAKKLAGEYPDAKIYCVNSLRACMGEGALAVEAARFAATGADADSVYEYVMTKRATLNQFVVVQSLEYMRRAGRVKASAAFFGNLLGVKPILIADAEGTQIAYKKVKGRLASIKDCIAMMKEVIVDPENQSFYFCHSDCSDEEVATVKKMIEDEIRPKEIIMGYIGPIIGASVGPDTLGFFAFGKEVTIKNEEK